MIKRIYTLLALFATMQTSFFVAAQDTIPKIRKDESQYIIQPEFEESATNSAFTHLWWFGDGGYKITCEPNATHVFHSDIRWKTATRYNGTNQYETYAISTENYGNTGPPPKLDTFVDISSLTTTVDHLPKVLDPSNPDQYIDIRNYRDAVPGDTVYFIVTYGIPESGEALSGESSIIEIDFGSDNEYFQYCDDSDVNRSFLPHRESFKGDPLLGPFKWNIRPDKIAVGGEHTMLLPFKYTGENTRGEFDVTADFKYRKFATPATLITSTEDVQMNFARSHDPNCILVSPDTTTNCAIGGDFLEYEIHFQNTGEGHTRYVRVDVQLDDMHELSTVDLIHLPDGFQSILEGALLGPNRVALNSGSPAYYEIDAVNNRISFEFHNLVLTGLSDTLLPHTESSKGQFTFQVRVKNDYVIGNPIKAKAAIIFDTNDPVETKEVITTCFDPVPSNSANSNANGSTNGTVSNSWCSCWMIWVAIGIIFLLLIIIIVLLRRRK
jgi:hypothetical protein